MIDKSHAITLLRMIGFLLPGNWLKTSVYLYAVGKVRKAIRLAVNGFYRMDHIYEALDEFQGQTRGTLSMLEFGTNEGYAFVKMLYATKYMHMADRVTVHGFDTFEGMPAPAQRSDLDVIRDREGWSKGQFKGGYEKLLAYCQERYSNFQLHRGRFDETLSDEFLASLASSPPMLVWIDCDFYSSAKSVFDRLIPWLPSGCIIYFDEIEFNYGTRFTGEARIVYEINQGMFGQELELVPDTALSWDTKRVYRLVRFEGGPHYEWIDTPPDPGRGIGNESPLP